MVGDSSFINGGSPLKDVTEAVVSTFVEVLRAFFTVDGDSSSNPALFYLT